MRLLPVPGPPVSTLTPSRSAAVDRGALRLVETAAPARFGLDRLGGREQPGDALGDAVLGLGVAGSGDSSSSPTSITDAASSAAAIAASASADAELAQRVDDRVAR